MAIPERLKTTRLDYAAIVASAVTINVLNYLAKRRGYVAGARPDPQAYLTNAVAGLAAGALARCYLRQLDAPRDAGE